MNYNLEEITRVASWGKKPFEVCHILGYDQKQFLIEVKKENSDVNIAYYKGFYSTEGKVLESLFNLAASGSSPAQAAAIKILDDTKKHLAQEGFCGFGED
jgi:hypothetical protein